MFYMMWFPSSTMPRNVTSLVSNSVYIYVFFSYKHAILWYKQLTWGCEVSGFMVQQSIYVLGKDINLYISHRQLLYFQLYPFYVSD